MPVNNILNRPSCVLTSTRLGALQSSSASATPVLSLGGARVGPAVVGRNTETGMGVFKDDFVTFLVEHHVELSFSTFSSCNLDDMLRKYCSNSTFPFFWADCVER